MFACTCIRSCHACAYCSHRCSTCAPVVFLVKDASFAVIMQRSNYNVVDHRISFVDTHGHNHEGVLTAYCWNDRSLSWSAARLFYLYFDDRKGRIDVGKEVKKLQDRMYTLLEALDVSTDCWIRPCRGCEVLHAEPTERNVAEWTMTMEALIYVLVVWSQNSKSYFLSNKALSLLAAFFAKTVSAPGAFEAERIITTVAEAFQLCAAGSNEEGMCIHVLETCTILRNGGGSQLRTAFVLFLTECAEKSANCLACRECLKIAVAYVSDEVRGEAVAWEPEVGLLKPRALDHRGKALRHVGAFKQSLKDHIQRKRKCITPAEVVALQGSNPKCVRSWRFEDLAIYLRAAWRTMSQCGGVFVLRADAAQLANPGRDTTHYFFENATTGTTVVLPPQVAPQYATQQQNRQPHCKTIASSPLSRVKGGRFPKLLQCNS